MQRNFTMIEMLVVIAVMLILVSILLPAISGAKKLGYKASCTSNLRQISVLNAAYFADSNDYIVMPGYQPDGVPLGGLDNAYPWDYVLSGYYKASGMMLFRCPLDPFFNPSIYKSRTTRSYKINAIHDTNLASSPDMVAADMDFPGGKRITSISRSPSQVMLFLCWSSVQTTFLLPVGYNRQYALDMYSRHWAQVGVGSYMMHCGSDNYAMIDGSVQSIAPSELFHAVMTLPEKWWVIRTGVYGVAY